MLVTILFSNLIFIKNESLARQSRGVVQASYLISSDVQRFEVGAVSETFKRCDLVFSKADFLQVNHVSETFAVLQSVSFETEESNFSVNATELSDSRDFVII